MTRLHFQDAHLHLQDARLTENLDQIIDVAREAGVNRMVVNGTHPDDWEKVSALHLQYPELIIPSYGLHPWKTPAKDDSWKSKLVHLEENNPLACVGECGLDRWMQNPDKEAQEDAFRFQLELAARLNKPISIHILKAWGWLFDILDSSPLPERGIMLHSFGGSKEVAQRLLKYNSYFSFSGYFLQQRKVKVLEAFTSLPLDRILLETDAPDMLPPEKWISHPLKDKLNHPANLSSIAQSLATILDLSPEAMSAQLERNFQQYFGM